MIRGREYPILPHISYGIIGDGGFYITLPFKGISLNQYKKLHHGKIKSLRGQYKSIIDLIMVASLKKNYIKEFNENGVKLGGSLFDNKIEIVWVLTFLDTNTRDVSNYTQKIMLDTVVSVGLLEDDNSKFVISDKTMFGSKKVDSVTCLMIGKLHKQKFLNAVPEVKISDIFDYLGVKK